MRLARTQLPSLLASALVGLAACTAAAADGDGDTPVQTFRKLLAMTPSEQEGFVSKYSPPIRERILAKLDEYKILPPDYRELRLEVTEMRWYLLPLMRTPPTNRVAQLKSVPDHYRAQVAARLEEWDLFPPTLKEELLQYESTLNSFVSRDAKGKMVVMPKSDLITLPDKERLELEQKLSSWQELSEEERNQVYGSFEHFLEFSDSEKQKTLDALDERERQNAEKVVAPVENWPKAQQQQYLAAFRKFADMTPEARQEFLKNVDRWQKMSPAERQAWRDLDRQLADMPPMPPDAPLRPQPTGPVAIPNNESNRPGAK